MAGKYTNKIKKYGTSKIKSQNRREANLIIQHIFHIYMIAHDCDDSNQYIFLPLPRGRIRVQSRCRVIIWKAWSCTIVGNVIEECHTSCQLKIADILRLRAGAFARRIIHATLQKNDTTNMTGVRTLLTRKRQVATVLNENNVLCVVVLREKL